MRAEVQVWLTRDRLGLGLFHREPVFGAESALWEEADVDSFVDLPLPELLFPVRLGIRRGRIILCTDFLEEPVDDVVGKGTLEEVKRMHCIAVLQRCNGNKTAAARELDVNIKTLHTNLGRWRS